MSDLFAPACSIAPTRRRRFLWAAWWTAPPSREPFRQPDAFHGGARTREAALSEAERAAGVRLVEIDARWARAWANILVGRPPWRAPRRGVDAPSRVGRAGARGEGTGGAARASVWAILGVTPDATEDELKRAFRKRALETHPDHGGAADAFRDVKRAYEEALRRRARPRARRAR